MLTYTEKMQLAALTFDGGLAKTTTRSGKAALVQENERNINRPYYSLDIEGKTVFTRGTIGKVFQVLNAQ